MSKSSLLAALAAGANSGSQYFGMVSQEAFLSKKRKETADYEAGLSSAAAEAQAASDKETLDEQRVHDAELLEEERVYETETEATAQANKLALQDDAQSATATLSSMQIHANALAKIEDQNYSTQERELRVTRENERYEDEKAFELEMTGLKASNAKDAAEVNQGYTMETLAAQIASTENLQGIEISARVKATLQAQSWQDASATLGYERTLKMAQKTEAFTLKRDELQNIALGERDAALASIAKDHATYMQGLSIEERKIQMGLDTEAFKEQAKFSAGLKKLEPTQAAGAVIQNDLRMQKDNDAIKSQVDVMNIMQELLKDDDVDGVISDKLKELSNALGWSFTDGQPRKAVWDMLQTILATDKLALFTGSTTDYEYKVVKSMFPGAGMDAASAKAQLDVYLSLAMGTYNDNVSRLKVNRKTQVGFNTLTGKQEQILGGSNTAKVAAPNQDESNINDVPEDWRQYTK
jgi:hypothetical protein